MKNFQVKRTWPNETQGHAGMTVFRLVTMTGMEVTTIALAHATNQDTPAANGWCTAKGANPMKDFQVK